MTDIKNILLKNQIKYLKEQNKKLSKLLFKESANVPPEDPFWPQTTNPVSPPSDRDWPIYPSDDMETRRAIPGYGRENFLPKPIPYPPNPPGSGYRPPKPWTDRYGRVHYDPYGYGMSPAPMGSLPGWNNLKPRWVYPPGHPRAGEPIYVFPYVGGGAYPLKP
jgi:hypothetical protein